MAFRKVIPAITIGAVLFFSVVAGPLFARGPRWRRVDVGQATNPMQAVYAFDSLHAWVSTVFHEVLNTKDGGSTWSTFTLGNVCCPGLGGGSIANSFFFFDTLNGWIAGHANNSPPPAGSFRLRTSDGGNSWVTQLDTGYKYGVQILFLNEHKGFDLLADGCSFRDSFLVTNDSGKTWQYQKTGIQSCEIQTFDFVDSLNGWGVFRYSPPVPGDSFGLMRTRDGGNTWTALPIHSAYCCCANIGFLDTLNGWIQHCDRNHVNQVRVSRTANGGLSWDSLYTFGSSYHLFRFEVVDTAHIWLAGRYGASYASVQFSSDGGRSWAEQMPGVGDDIIGLDVADSNHAFAIGAEANVYIYSPPLIGDLNLDWALSPADVVLMLNYTFAGLPTSVPAADMDFNNDCEVTPADVVLLLIKVFAGGPPLQAGCTGP